MDLHQPAFHASALESAIRGCGLGCQTLAPEGAVGAHRAKVREGVLIRQTKVRMVENVEEASTQFKLHALGDREALVDVHVRVKVAQTTEAVPRNVSETRLVDAASSRGELSCRNARCGSANRPRACRLAIGRYATNAVGRHHAGDLELLVGKVDPSFNCLRSVGQAAVSEECASNGPST